MKVKLSKFFYYITHIIKIFEHLIICTFLILKIFCLSSFLE
ncbi:hypothetical protein PCS8203_00224 [Streptococcus pneumoniae PCS8203]|nr:hypothetical protein PCS8203_00224 [Streptococcus pneumoniae PCS8203]